MNIPSNSFSDRGLPASDKRLLYIWALTNAAANASGLDKTGIAKSLAAVFSKEEADRLLYLLGEGRDALTLEEREIVVEEILDAAPSDNLLIFN